MKMHKLETYERTDGKTIKYIRCSSQQYNARFRRTSTEDWDEVTCLRCKPPTSIHA